MNEIYMDHAATTPVRQEVVEAMLPFFGSEYGNPSSVYGWGRRSRQALDQARDKVSELIGAEASEIIFTSGGSEGANLAIKGVAWAYQKKGRHCHKCCRAPCCFGLCTVAEKQGFEVTIVPGTKKVW